MARTLVTGNILRSGSIPTTALGGGVVTSSLQIVASLPTGSLSSSAQVDYTQLQNIPSGIVSSSGQVSYLGLSNIPSGIASSSTQVTAYLPTDTVSSSVQVTAFLPAGTVSSSGQVDVFSTIGGGALATTGSNTFTAAQTISDTTNSTSYLDGALHIAGGMSVRKDVRISGSMTINGLLTAVSMSTQYVTSSEYVVGTSRITLNDDDNVRFAGLSIIDSGSASPTSASIFWDSLNHHFIYENLSGSAYNSAIIIAGPKHTGTLGDEPTLTSGYITVATGTDHIDNSVMFQSASNIGIGTTTPSLGTLQINGNVHATSYTGSISGSSITANTLAISGTAGASIARINATQDQSILSFTDTQDNSGYFGIRSAVEAGEQGASFFTDGALFFGRLISGSFTERMRINSSGYLLVNANSSIGVGDSRLQVGNGSSGASAQLLLKTTAGHSALYSTTSSNTYLTWASGGFFALGIAPADGSTFTEYMRIDTSGNLGVGTTSPGANLQVNRTGAGIIQRIYQTDSNQAYINLGNVTTGLYAQDFSIAGGMLVGIDTDETAIIWHGSNYALRFGTNGTERARIDASGNLLVGTTSTGADGIALNNTRNYSWAEGSGDSYANIFRQRNTAATVVASGYKRSATGLFASSYGTSMARAAIAVGYNNGSIAFFSDSATNIANGTDMSPTERVTILNNGNVGIGTGSPAGPLQVVATGEGSVGTINIRGSNAHLGLMNSSGQFRGWFGYFNAAPHGSETDLNIKTGYNGTSNIRISANGDSTPAQLYIANSGNIGIATTNPAYTLDVIGQIKGDAFLGKNFDSYSYSAGTLTLNTVTGSGPRLYNYVIRANPNSGGSSSYSDFLYGKIIIGTGWNGSAVTNFINVVQENPNPRDLYGSGGGNLTVDAVFFTSAEFTSLASGTSYTIRLKISGFSADPNGITALISQIGI